MTDKEFVLLFYPKAKIEILGIYYLLRLVPGKWGNLFIESEEEVWD